MIVQLLLVVVACVAMIAALSSRGSQRVNAWKKIALVASMLVMIAVVIEPELLTYFANTIGVGRGTDLVLYVLSSVFIFYVINQYLKNQDQQQKVVQLTRQVALSEAKSRYKLYKK